MKLAVRGFAGSVKVFEDLLEIEESYLEQMFTIHGDRLAGYPQHMIEFEILSDDPGPHRFWCMATDRRSFALALNRPDN